MSVAIAKLPDRCVLEPPGSVFISEVSLSSDPGLRSGVGPPRTLKQVDTLTPKTSQFGESADTDHAMRSRVWVLQDKQRNMSSMEESKFEPHWG